MENEFDKLFHYSCKAQKLIGCHPFIPRNFQWFRWYILWQSIYIVQLFIFGYSLIFNDLRHNVPSAFSDICMIMIYFIIQFKQFVMLRYRKIFIDIITIMNQHYVFYKTKSAEEQAVIEKYVSKGKFVVKTWLFLMISSTFGFTCKPVVSMLVLKFMNKFSLVPIFDLHFPPLFHKLGDDLLFTLVFSINTFFAIYSCTSYLSVVPMGPIFMTHTCGQMEICALKVNKLFDEENNLSRKERKELINDIVKQTHDIYDFVEQLKTSFMLLYEMTLKGSSWIIPILVYEIIQTVKTAEYRLEFVLIFVGAILICSTPCYYGEMLLEKSDELRNAIYGCGWENEWDKPTRTSILIMLTRMQRPTVIRSIFRVICLESLAEVFSTAYSLFNLLIAVYE